MNTVGAGAGPGGEPLEADNPHESATHTDQAATMLVRVSRTAAVWALLYALYRWYYAAGGTIGMLGTPGSDQQWRLINGIAGALIAIAAVLPLVLLKAWRSPSGRRLLPALCWLIAVACVTHALIGMIQRVASLAGLLTIRYPFWQSIDARKADLQALFFNEPWFLVEGLLWIAIAWYGALHASRHRLWWLGSVAAAVALLTAVGVLSAFGVIGRLIIG